MSSAARYIPHYTVDEYRQWRGDWELWSGVPVAMTPPPFGPHQAVAARLIRVLGNQLDAAGCDCEVLHEIDWIVSEDTVVRPDVLVVCGGVPEMHVIEPPVFIAEIVSPSTEQKDRGAKFALYGQFGVEYYLVLDSSKQTLEAYRRTSDGAYELLDFTAPLTLSLHPTCRVTLGPGDLFKGRGEKGDASQ